MTFGNNSRSDFVDFTKPVGAARMKLYETSRSPYDQPINAGVDPAKGIPQGLLDALAVREEVFVKEQGLPLAHEVDEDDARAFHWVAYASIPASFSSSDSANGNTKGDGANAAQERRSNKSTKLPIGTIRLIPPPNSLPEGRIPFDTSEIDANVNYSNIRISEVREPWLRLSRLAVRKEFRKTGISQLLVNTALNFARENPYDVIPNVDPSKVEALRQENSGNLEFEGLVLVHSQTGVQKLWRRYGFATDEAMGSWDEEGIQHVGMWKRLDLTSGRRASKVQLPPASLLVSP